MPISAKDNVPETFKDAHLLEGNNDWKHAAAMYERLLKQSPNNIKIVNRLIIVYRKLKASTKEIVTINKAIKYYEGQYVPLKKTGSQVSALSKKLNRMLGHIDSKGKSSVQSADILKLEKRRDMLLKKGT